jgi:hypothetical protein
MPFSILHLLSKLGFRFIVQIKFTRAHALKVWAKASGPDMTRFLETSDHPIPLFLHLTRFAHCEASCNRHQHAYKNT